MPLKNCSDQHIFGPSGIKKFFTSTTKSEKKGHSQTARMLKSEIVEQRQLLVIMCQRQFFLKPADVGNTDNANSYTK